MDFETLVSLYGPTLLAVVGTAFVFFFYKGMKQIAASLPQEPGLGIDDVARSAVLATEQIFFNKDGEFKLNEAIKLVKNIFPEVEDAEVRMWIEAAVKVMNEAVKD